MRAEHVPRPVGVQQPLLTASLLAGPNCLRCTDFSNRFADIALGATGSDPGFTSVLVRTEHGRALFEGALEAGYVAEWGTVFDKDAGKEIGDRVRVRLAEQARRKVELARRASSKTRA